MNQDVSREKTPGQTCVGVMPVPATPTENKTLSFPTTTTTTTTNKKKPKENPSNSTQERPKGNTGIEKLEQKPKLDQKHKSSSDSSRHKPLKLGEKLNEKKENKDAKIVNKISLEKYKSNQASAGDKTNTLSVNKQKAGVKDDGTTNNKNQELNNEDGKVVKKEETSETPHQEPTKVEKSTPQKTKPTPLQLPNR
jgi:hypothetical protein